MRGEKRGGVMNSLFATIILVFARNRPYKSIIVVHHGVCGKHRSQLRVKILMKSMWHRAHAKNIP